MDLYLSLLPSCYTGTVHSIAESDGEPAGT